jgi:tripartite-type tricarboxylate transporter receptor subunit TctC
MGGRKMKIKAKVERRKAKGSRFHFLLSTSAFLLCGALSASAALAQSFPARPIRVVVPFPPGGSIDIVFRSIAQRWSPLLGQPIVVDNRGGAGGALGAKLVAAATADGYTLLYGNAGPLAIGPHLTPDIGYDIFRDFAPVSQTTSAPFMIFASAKLPVATAQELIAYARQRPGQLNYASSGIGSGLHLMGELFKSVTGVSIVHVPFKGMGQAAPEIASGRVQLAVSTVPGVLPHVRAGRMKGIVSSGARRSPQLPSVQTCTEAGVPGFCSMSFHALVAPAGTPRPAIARLHGTLAQALSEPDLREQLLKSEDSEAVGGTPPELAKLLRSESAKWSRVIKAIGVKGE